MLVWRSHAAREVGNPFTATRWAGKRMGFLLIIRDVFKIAKRKMFMKWRWILLAVWMTTSTVVLAGEKYIFARPEQRERYEQVLRQFRCLVCQNEDLASSEAPLAEDLRWKIYLLMQQGKTDPEITDYLVSRYGNFILFKPPWLFHTVWLWLGPLFFLVLGTVIVFRVIARYTHKGH